MNAARNSNLQWYQEVVQPRLDILNRLAEGSKKYEDVDLKPFFKDLLTDLEMIELDNFTVERYAERILNAMIFFKEEDCRKLEPKLKSLALVSTSGVWDRIFYLDYWRLYRPLKKNHPEITDQAILDAFKLNIYTKALVFYVTSAIEKK